MSRLRSLPRPFQEGFTFNEVLVAMTVVAVVVTGLFLGTMSLMRGNRANDNITTAVNLAQHKLEQLRSSRILRDDDRCPAGGEKTLAAGGGLFDVCWKIAPSGLGPWLKEVEVTVTWREQGDREIRFSTVVFDQGAV
jgi:prepilin-type N-terminal cleavage/methylation domain-containing protein